MRKLRMRFEVSIKMVFVPLFIFLFFPLKVEANLLNEAESYLQKLRKITFLKDRKSSLERPKQCIYKEDLQGEVDDHGKTSQNLLLQFKEMTELLKKEECREAGKSTFLKIEKDLDEMRKIQEKFMKDSKMTTAKKGLTDFSGARWDPALGNKVLENWGKLTQVPACKDRFKARKVLGYMTNFTTNLLFTGMLVPGRIGQVSAYYNLALGSTMKLFRMILESYTDYVDPVQREAFLKMNCAFFEYENILDREGFFSIHSLEQKNELLKIEKTYLPKLQDYIDKIKKPMNKHQEKFFIKNYGEVNFSIFNFFQDIKPIVKTKGRGNRLKPRIKGPFITKIWNSYDYIVLKKNWEKAKLDYEMKSAFPYFIIVFKNNFKGYNDHKSFVSKMMRDNKEWNKVLDSYFDGLTPLVEHYDSMGKKSLTSFQKTQEYLLLQKIIRYRDVFYHRIKVLNNIVKGELGFLEYDDGRTDRWRIVDEYKTFEKNIFGKEGKKFISNINYSAQKSIKLIKKQYKIIVDQYEYKKEFTKNLSNEDKMKAYCSDINYYVDSYDDYNTIVRQGHDFIKINSRYFARSDHKKKWTRYFQRKAWQERYLHKNYFSLLKAEELRKEVQKWKEENKDKLEDFPKALMKKLKEKKNTFSKRTLGRHILNREIHSINLKDIIEIKEKHCKQSTAQ